MISRLLYHTLLNRLLVFLFAFYGVYILFDFSMHSSDMHSHSSSSLPALITYYFYNFIKRLDLLLPLSLLLATINIITSLNQNRELLALQTSGRSLQSILKPFVVAGLFACLIVGANFQFLLPKAQKYIDGFEKARHTKLAKAAPIAIRSVSLNSGGKLIFSHYTSTSLLDAYLLSSPKEVWHFKKLEEEGGKIIGYGIDHLVREDSMELVKRESFDKMEVPFLSPPLYEPSADEEQPFENFSISSLFSKLLQTPDASSRSFCLISSQLYYKIAMPWFSLILILGIIPSCTQFSRSNKNLLIYTGGLVGFVIFFTIMDAAVILGENNIVSPIVAVLTPISMLLTLLGIRFTRLR